MCIYYSISQYLGAIRKKRKQKIFIDRKKSFSIFPSLAGMSLIKLSLGGNNLYMTPLFPPRESLVSDIRAVDGNIEKFFYGILWFMTM
jgi:hypothetical protein